MLFQWQFIFSFSSRPFFFPTEEAVHPPRWYPDISTLNVQALSSAAPIQSPSNSAPNPSSGWNFCGFWHRHRELTVFSCLILFLHYFLFKYAAKSLKWQGSPGQMLFPANLKYFSLSLGENVDSKAESPRLQMAEDQSKDYEITIPFLLNGEQWRPVDGIYSKVSLHFAYLFVLRSVTI